MISVREKMRAALEQLKRTGESFRRSVREDNQSVSLTVSVIRGKTCPGAASAAGIFCRTITLPRAKREVRMKENDCHLLP